MVLHTVFHSVFDVLFGCGQRLLQAVRGVSWPSKHGGSIRSRTHLPDEPVLEGMCGNRSRVGRRGMAWDWQGRSSVPRHLDPATPNTGRQAKPEAWSGRGPAPTPAPAGTASAIVPVCMRMATGCGPAGSPGRASGPSGNRSPTSSPEPGVLLARASEFCSTRYRSGFRLPSCTRPLLPILAKGTALSGLGGPRCSWHRVD
jgi:hypothetical protein